MTRNEALDIAGMIASHWPGSNWTADTIDAYARAIEPLDATIATRAVLRCVNELDRYPRVATLREFVRMEKRLTDYDRALQETAVESQRMQGKPSAKNTVPEWVKGWAVSRARHHDMRVWPQQDPDGFADNPMPVAEQEQYIGEGGGLPINMIFTALLGDV